MNRLMLIILTILLVGKLYANTALVMWLDNRSPVQDQESITAYIKTQFNDNVTIELSKLAIWHSVTNYDISGWVLSSDYKKIEDHGVDIQDLILHGIPTATSNLLNPEYLKWFVASNSPVQTLKDMGYGPATNKPSVK